MGVRNRAAAQVRHVPSAVAQATCTPIRIFKSLKRRAQPQERRAQPRRARPACRAADAGGVHHAPDSDGNDSDGNDSDGNDSDRVARVGVTRMARWWWPLGLTPVGPLF